MPHVQETIAHRFWDCKVVRNTWGFAIGLINTMKETSQHKDMWRPLGLYKIFGKKVLSSLSKFSKT